MKIFNLAYGLKVLVLMVLMSGLSPSNIMAQAKKDQLKSKQRKMEKKISYTKKLLSETKNKRNVTLTEYNLLKNQVQDRKILIRTYNSEVEMLDAQIKSKRLLISQLKEDLANLKEEYAALIYQSYKSRNIYDQWMFLFASEDFYHAFRRMKYLQEYNEYRRNKAEDIVSITAKLESEIQELKQKKDERLGILIIKEKETKSLESDSKAKQKIANNLKSEEQKLRSQLNKQKREWKKMDKEIQRLIEIEIRNKEGKSGRLPLTPEEQKLSDNFTANKGKLPWPSARGVITTRFGLQQHDQLNVQVNNKGIDIRCEKGSVARAVFDGKVVRVIQMQQYKAVLIKHGDYYTVYTQLSSVSVSAGDMVKTKQSIGTVWTNVESGESILHFEVKVINKNPKEKGLTKNQNPESWMTRR